MSSASRITKKKGVAVVESFCDSNLIDGCTLFTRGRSAAAGAAGGGHPRMRLEESFLVAECPSNV